MIVSMRAVHVAARREPSTFRSRCAVFVIPFLLFSGYSGQLADRLSKRSVLISVKVFEIGVMAAGIAVFFSTRIEWMLVILFLMALHSTIFSPAKYGIVPEMLPDKDLSRANGLLEMSTFVAIVLGTSIGRITVQYVERRRAGRWAWRCSRSPWRDSLTSLRIHARASLAARSRPFQPQSFRRSGHGHAALCSKIVRCGSP